MTTADIVFAQPGNPDRLRDYEQNARTIFWALLAAILIHLLVAFLLAAFSGFFSPALPAPEKPVELTRSEERRVGKECRFGMAMISERIRKISEEIIEAQ